MNNPTAIHPFRIDIPEAAVADLARRLDSARWPGGWSDDDDWSRGVPLGYLRGLAEYWRRGFDWRAREAALNTLPQFMTTIDGQPIHFVHVRSRHAGATPLLIT